MSETIETLRQIKSKGHWKLVLRPFPHKERVPSITDLEGILQRSSVQLRGGWDFPHVDRSRGPKFGTDYIEQAVNLEGGSDFPDIKEFWRFCQSGQFIYFGAFLLDWTRSTSSWTQQPPADPSRQPLLGAGDIVCRYAEFMEFASALSLSEAGSSRIGVEITPTRLCGRVLWLDHGHPIPTWEEPPTAHIDGFPRGQEFPRDELVAETRSIGLAWARELFRRFGLDPGIDRLEQIRSDFR